MDTNYDELSDLQIECLVSAEKWKEKCLSKQQWNNVAQRTYKEIQAGTCVYADARYCSNPYEIMPIAIKHGFSIELPDENLGGIGQITKYVPNDTDIVVEFTDKPYRAISICFLKLKDATND